MEGLCAARNKLRDRRASHLLLPHRLRGLESDGPDGTCTLGPAHARHGDGRQLQRGAPDLRRQFWVLGCDGRHLAGLIQERGDAGRVQSQDRAQGLNGRQALLARRGRLRGLGGALVRAGSG